MLIDVGYALACVCCVCSWGALCIDIVFGTSFGPCSYVVCSVCHGGLSALTLSDGPDVGDKRG